LLWSSRKCQPLCASTFQGLLGEMALGSIER
jgi:hypothetical protein